MSSLSKTNQCELVKCVTYDFKTIDEVTDDNFAKNNFVASEISTSGNFSDFGSNPLADFSFPSSSSSNTVPTSSKLQLYKAKIPSRGKLAQEDLLQLVAPLCKLAGRMPLNANNKLSYKSG